MEKFQGEFVEFKQLTNLKDNNEVKYVVMSLRKKEDFEYLSNYKYEKLQYLNISSKKYSFK